MGWWSKRRSELSAHGRLIGRLDVDDALNRLDDIEQRLRSTPPAALRRLDRAQRQRTLTDPNWFPQWLVVRPDDVARLAKRSGRPTTVGALLAMHPDGHVREAAVTLLGRTPSEEALPYLALRALDWVPQVRQAAASAIAPLVAPEHAPALISILPILDPWSSDADPPTPEGAALRQQITRLLGDADLVRALSTADGPARRWCARQMVARGAAASGLDAALRQSDPVVARTIGEACATERPDDVGVSGALLGSKVGRLRELGLHRFQAADDPSAMTRSDASLLDRAGGVRFLAQRYLAARGVDVRARYLALVDDHPLAVTGLAEVARPDDAATIAGFLAHESAPVRSRAVKAYARLAGPHAFDDLVRALDDPEPSVVRAAGRALAAQSLRQAQVDALWPHLETTASVVRRDAVFAALRRQDRWTALTSALRAIVEEDEDLRRRGRELLAVVLEQRWNRSFTSPSAADVPQIRQRLLDAIPLLDDASRAQLAFATDRYVDRR